MKLSGISISTPRLPRPLNSKMAARSSSYAFGRKTVHKPLLMGAGESSDGSSSSSKAVPKGFLAVYVGPQSRRFVIPISFLSMPDMRVLMDSVAEEFGCDHHGGGALQIPCDEDHFEHILMNCFARQRMISSKTYKIKLGKIKTPLIYSH